MKKKEGDKNPPELPEKYEITEMIDQLIRAGYGDEEFIRNNFTIGKYWLITALNNRRFYKC